MKKMIPFLILFFTNSNFSFSQITSNYTINNDVSFSVLCNCGNVYEPVCGDDGLTYPNSCVAECAGILNYTTGVCNVMCDSLPNFTETYFKARPIQVLQTYDCGYLVFGMYIPSQEKFLMKTSKKGELWWKINLEDSSYRTVIETEDGGLMLLKSDYDSTLQSSITILEKRNSSGEFLWTSDLQGMFPSDVFKTANNELIIAGSKNVLPTLDEPEVLTLVDELGNLIWQNEYDTLSTDYAWVTSTTVKEAANGEFLLGGLGRASGFNPYKQKLMKVDASGNVLWDTEVGNGGIPSTLNDFEILPNGEIIVIGTEEFYSNSAPGFNKKAVVTKLDSDGNEIWREELCAQIFNYERLGYEVAINDQGVIAVAGKFCGQFDYVSNPPFSGWQCTEDLAMSFLDQDGVTECKFDAFRSNTVTVTQDGGFIFAGTTSFNGNLFLSKTDNEGNVTLATPTILETAFVAPSNSFQKEKDFQVEKIYPNPALDKIFIDINGAFEKQIDLQIYDARGVVVKTKKEKLSFGKNKIQINVEALPKGMYSVFIPQMVNEKMTMRFVK